LPCFNKNIDFADIENNNTEHNFKSNHDFSAEIIRRDSKGTASCFLEARKAQVTFAEKSQIKIDRLYKHKHGYLIHT